MDISKSMSAGWSLTFAAVQLWMSGLCFGFGVCLMVRGELAWLGLFVVSSVLFPASLSNFRWFLKQKKVID